MGMMQRRKGATAEREFAGLCRLYGLDVRRGGQLYQKGSYIADCVGLDGVHIECKRVERLNVQAAMEQSIRDAIDAGRGEVPIVAHRRNRKNWLVTMNATDFLKLFKKAAVSNEADCNP